MGRKGQSISLKRLGIGQDLFFPSANLNTGLAVTSPSVRNLWRRKERSKAQDGVRVLAVLRGLLRVCTRASS